MSDDGYTLAEMLAALLMLGLAIGGLSQGLRVVGMLQSSAGKSVHDQRTLRAGQARFVALLDRQGPFRSTEPTFQGDGGAFEFPCAEAGRCGARLEDDGKAVRMVLRGADMSERAVALPRGDVQFVYDGADGAYSRWPPEGARQLLKSVSLMRVSAEGQAPLMSARVWLEQAPDCAFDAIAQDCREGGQ